MRFYIVDCFAEEKYQGNELLVLKADRPVTDEEQQEIAEVFGIRTDDIDENYPVHRRYHRCNYGDSKTDGFLLLPIRFLLRYSSFTGKIYDRRKKVTMGKIFSDERVNTGRQIELDLAKCSAIFFMIFLHCYFAMSYFDYDISLFLERGIAQLVGGPFAAPVFMFAMGVGMVYSRNQEPRYLIVRGIKLLQLGFFVNIGEFFVPHFLAGNLMDDWDRFPIANGLLLFCIDILAFAGMAFMLVGVLKKLKVSTKGMVIVSVADK